MNRLFLGRLRDFSCGLLVLSLTSCGLFSAYDGEKVSSSDIAEFGRFLSLINGFEEEGLEVRVTILNEDMILGEATFDLAKLKFLKEEGNK